VAVAVGTGVAVLSSELRARRSTVGTKSVDVGFVVAIGVRVGPVTGITSGGFIASAKIEK
jgi:hypothetical protein